MQAHNTLSNIENGQDFPFRVVWDADTQTLEVYFGGDLRLTYTGNIAATFFGGNPLVHWGFVASTGCRATNSALPGGSRLHHPPRVRHGWT